MIFLFQSNEGGFELFFSRYMPTPNGASKVFIKFKVDFLLVNFGMEIPQVLDRTSKVVALSGKKLFIQAAVSDVQIIEF